MAATVPEPGGIFFIGVELFLFTFALNSAAAWSVRRLVRKMSGAAA